MGSAPFQVLVAKSPLSGEDAAARRLLDPAWVPGGRTRSKHGAIAVCSGVFQGLLL